MGSNPTMAKFNRIKIIEFERTGGEWPMIYGKGQRKNDLIYFQLDATFIRQPQSIRKERYITVTEDEVIGVAESFLPA